MEFYSTERVAPGVTRIKSLQSSESEFIFLVEGSERAALVDTGIGLGHLGRLVAGLTDLPVDVLLTHGHTDHAGGAVYFDEVYIHPADIEVMHEHLAMPRSEDKALLARLDADGYNPAKPLRYLPLYGGDTIDLGGRSLEVVHTPGHTLGSLVFWDRANRLLFTGDACNKRTFLFLDHSTTVAEYMYSLLKMLELLPGVDHIYNAHDEGELPREVPMNVLACCIEILNGRDEAVPFEFMGLQGRSAHAIAQGVERADGKQGNIVYNPDRLCL